MFDGTECTLPTAHAHIETPFFKGNVVALVLSLPVGDIIPGNIVGVNDSLGEKVMAVDINESHMTLENVKLQTS